MSLTATTLSAGCSASDIVLAITSTSSGFPGIGVQGSRQMLRVDNELMYIDYVVKSGVVKVMMRGLEGGGPAVAHDVLTDVQTSSDPQDFGNDAPGAPVIRPPWTDDFVTIGQNMTFTAVGTAPVLGTSMPLPIRDTTYWLNKATLVAITLISTTGAYAGQRLRFVNMVAVANTVTYTPGFLGDTTASDVATAAAKVGAILEIVAGPTGLWGVVNADLISSHDSNWTLA